MQTVYDWVTVAIFCGLITLYLHRSVDEDEPGDSLWQYLVASTGCAFTNWLGNEGYQLAAIGMLALTLGFIHYVLAPFRSMGGGKS
ncbi:XrtV sorting system accessory protein [Sphingomonas sp. 37zxx]|uniref:XrtV sorting system accessory protein n=1 Tax=Sphingomonas sp. 37zxx TaxID=1550073 RepID=UPI00053BE4AA|nr:XrtV sorting system accessory protein [Sphingomonas sp. 37zxx]